MFDQRFNVAASRAQHRMYLVRSLVASDLSYKDLRASLLSDFDKPMVLNIEDTAKLIDLCESGFERDVYSSVLRKVRMSRTRRFEPLRKQLDEMNEWLAGNRISN